MNLTSKINLLQVELDLLTEQIANETKEPARKILAMQRIHTFEELRAAKRLQERQMSDIIEYNDY
jgi:hypothetical protein